MAKYLREAGSQFPDAIYSPTGFLDATDEIMGLINQIKDLQLEKDTKKIQELINKNSQLNK